MRKRCWSASLGDEDSGDASVLVVWMEDAGVLQINAEVAEVIAEVAKENRRDAIEAGEHLSPIPKAESPKAEGSPKSQIRNRFSLITGQIATSLQQNRFTACQTVVSQD